MTLRTPFCKQRDCTVQCVQRLMEIFLVVDKVEVRFISNCNSEVNWRLVHKYRGFEV